MKKISQIRHDAALQIQDEVAEALLAKAASDEKDADKMMKTLRDAGRSRGLLLWTYWFKKTCLSSLTNSIGEQITLRTTNTPSNTSICQMLNMVLTMNNFRFDGEISR